MGMYILLFAGTTPIGSYICGQLAEHVGGGGAVGSRATVLISAGLCAVGVITGLIYARRSSTRATGEEHPRPATAADDGSSITPYSTDLEKDQGAA
jgi:hypothetical protein